MQSFIPFENWGRGSGERSDVYKRVGGSAAPAERVPFFLAPRRLSVLYARRARCAYGGPTAHDARTCEWSTPLC